MHDLYEGLLLVDFYSTGDLESRLYKMLTGFSSPHVGLVLNEYVLLCPSEGKPTGWYRKETIERLMGSSKTSSFAINPPVLDGPAIAIMGEGHLISPRHVRIYNEIVTYYNLPLPNTRSTSCVGIISNILRMSGVPVRGRTAKELHDELRNAADLCGSGCMVEEVVSAGHKHARR